MPLPTVLQAAYGVYRHRSVAKKACIGVLIVLVLFILIVYIIIATAFAVIQGKGNVAEQEVPTNLPFTEFERFSYKTIYGERWFEFAHPYMFPTLGIVTQGVILDASAKVGLKHIAWDIADIKSRSTEVRAFADGTVFSIKENMLYNTTRRWRFCESSASGICWYEVREPANIQVGCGYEVIIQHADGVATQYCHLTSYPALQPNDPVTVGQVIGYQGGTGWATGKHLHFAIYKEGQPLDPAYVFTQRRLDNWVD